MIFVSHSTRLMKKCNSCFKSGLRVWTLWLKGRKLMRTEWIQYTFKDQLGRPSGYILVPLLLLCDKEFNSGSRFGSSLLWPLLFRSEAEIEEQEEEAKIEKSFKTWYLLKQQCCNFRIFQVFSTALFLSKLKVSLILLKSSFNIREETSVLNSRVSHIESVSCLIGDESSL